MRHSAQLALTAPWIGHVHAMDLAAISALLDEEAGFAALVQQDLEAACIFPQGAAAGTRYPEAAMRTVNA